MKHRKIMSENKLAEEYWIHTLLRHTLKSQGFPKFPNHNGLQQGDALL
jgi:hypothetical protein